MIRPLISNIDRIGSRLTGGIEDLIRKIPRRLSESLLTVIVAVAVFYLFDKNIYYGLASVVAMFAGLALMRRPVSLIYIIFAFTPVAWINLLGRRLRVITFLSILAFAYYFGRAVAKRLSPPKEPVLFAYLGFIATVFLSLINSYDVAFSLTTSKYFILSMMFGLAMVMAIEDEKHLRTLIWILLAWGVALSVLSLLQSAVSIKFYPAYYFRVFGIKIVEQYSVQGIRRASGTFENGPRYAMYLLGPTAIAVTAFWRNLEGRRLLWGSLLMVFMVGLLVSFTRAAIVFGSFYVFLYNIFERNLQTFFKSVAWALIVVIVFSAAVVVLLPHNVTDAMFARFEDEDDEKYLDRFSFLYNALMAWTENPILGIGIGTYPYHSWDLFQKYRVPWESLSWNVNPLDMPQSVAVHNDYGRMLAETGIFSLIFFLMVYYFSFRNYFFVINNSKNSFYVTLAIGFGMYLGVMIPYWFFHEYIMTEPYTSMIPTIMSVLLKRLTIKEIESRDDTQSPDEIAVERSS